MDAAELPTDVLIDEVLTWAARVARGDAHLVLLIGEVEAREAWAGDGVTSCAHWLSWKLGWSSTTARERVRVGRALRDLPLIVQAFLAGRVTYCQVRAITRIATADDQEKWLELARHCTGEQLDKAARGAARAVAADRPESQRDDRGPAVHKEWDTDGDLILTLRIPAHQAVPVLIALEQHQAAEQSEREDRLAALVADVTGAPAGALDGLQLELPSPREGADHEEPERDAAGRQESGASAEAPPSSASGTASGIDLRSVPAARTTDPLQEYPYVEPAYPLSFERTQWNRTEAQQAADRALIEQWEVRRDAERAVRDAWNARREQLLMQASARKVPTGRATLADGFVRAVLRPTDCAPVTVQLLPDPLTGWARTPHDELLPPATLATMLEALPRKRTRRGPIALTRHDQGRSTRDVSPALRRLLGALDGERCRFPGCHHTRYLHAHHVTFWRDGGSTDLENLVLLCTRHHRLLHNQNYLLVLDAQRNITVTRADGSSLRHQPELRGASAEALPPADAETLNRDCHGDRYDLGYVVHTMLSHAA